MACMMGHLYTAGSCALDQQHLCQDEGPAVVPNSYRPPAPFLALALAATARPRPPTPMGSFLACNSPLVMLCRLDAPCMAKKPSSRQG